MLGCCRCVVVCLDWMRYVARAGSFRLWSVMRVKISQLRRRGSRLTDAEARAEGQSGTLWGAEGPGVLVAWENRGA